MSNVNWRVCQYIYEKWIVKSVSQRAFALDHDIEESVVRKIKRAALNKDQVNYSIPVITLKKICDGEEITLAEFFSMVEL